MFAKMAKPATLLLANATTFSPVPKWRSVSISPDTTGGWLNINAFLSEMGIGHVVSFPNPCIIT